MADWTLAGYTELRPLGQGGFGRVALARHDASGTIVAIKYLFARHLAEPALRDQFRHEAALLARVESPHVARLYTFQETERGAAIVMEAVAGVSLRAILDADGALPPESALAVLKGSLLGLAAAHGAGVVHRDYKPDNVLVQADRESKLVDFGLAVFNGGVGLDAGTPAYLSPEQWSGQPASPTTDVYAATCVFFLCVAGHRPYWAEDTEVMRTLHQNAPIPFGEVPEPVRAVVARGMAKDPAHRPSDAASFVTELETAARAGYGEDWEQRGRRALAARAATLLALSPLALIGSTAAVGTGATGVGAAAGGAGAAGSVGATTGAVAGKGVLATVGAKVAAAAVAVAVVGAVAAVVVTQLGKDDPTPAALAVVAQPLDKHYTDPDFDILGGALQVTGGPDPAVTTRINDALMAPIEARATALRGGLSASGFDEKITTTTVTSIELQTPGLLSVRYDHTGDERVLSHPTWHFDEYTTIDLQRGTVIGPRQAFRQEAFTERGSAELMSAILAQPGGNVCAKTPGDFETSLPDRLADGAIQFAYTTRGMEFLLNMPDLGFETACGQPRVVVSYDRIRDLLDPAPLALATTATGTAASTVDVGTLHLPVPEGWLTMPSAQGGTTVYDPATCQKDDLTACHQFLVTDSSHEYRLGAPYPSGESCAAAGRDDLPLPSAGTLRSRTTQRIGGQSATVEQWHLRCAEGVELDQRLWYLPGARVVIVDQWQEPALDQALQQATVS